MPFADGTFLGVELSPIKVLFGLLVACVSYLFLKLAKFSTSPLALLPTLPGLPLLGGIPNFFTDGNAFSIQHRFMNAAGEDGLVRILRLQGWIVSVCKPEYIKHILVTNSKKYMKPDFFKAMMKHLNGGILLSHGSEHAWQRKLMNPMFSHSAVKCYIESIERHCADLLKLWSEKCKTAPSGEAHIIVRHDIARMTLDVIGDTAFGHDFKSVVSGDNETSKAFRDILEGRFSTRGLLINYIVPFYSYIPTKSNRAAQNAIAIASKLVEEVLNHRRQQETEADSLLKDRDLLSVLMKACAEDSEKKMTDALLVSNVWTFMVAGYETTSAGLSWTLYHLARNQEIQEKARKEAIAVLREGENLQSEDVEKLVYITAVIKESLRRTPAVPAFFRQSLEDDKLGDLVIPKGTVLLLPVAGIHTCEKFWPDPWKFIPERFLESDEEWSSGIQGQTYFPFSHGPRSCIGSKFALMEMKLVLARLLKTFSFFMDSNQPESKARSGLSLIPLQPHVLQVSLAQRKGSTHQSSEM